MSTNLSKAIDTRQWTGMVRLMLTATLILAAAMISFRPAAARGAPESFADLAEKLSPAVVNISTVQTLPARTGRRMPNLPEGMPFGDLWDQFRDRMEEDEEPRQAQSLGSGFIIDASGIVITNNHVVEDADEITVINADGDEFPAKLLGRDALSDLAVLKIEGENGEPFPFVKWGDSDKERIGDWVMAIGNPFGLSSTVTAGIVSARNRSINTNDVEFIQTDASINRGNSGGPLFNMDGDVIGVNTAIFSPSGGNVGIGFAIPSNDAARVARELQEHGKVRRGWLGVGIQPMTKEIAESLGIDQDEGAMVTRVEPDSPAAKGGIQDGDIVVKWDGKEVENSNRLSLLVKRTDIGKPVDVIVIRKGKRVTLKVTTGELPAELAQLNPEADQDGDGRPDAGQGDRQLIEGMELAPLNDGLRRQYEIDENINGVIVLRVARGTPAARVRIRPGTVILGVNQRDVTNPTEVTEIIDAAREAGRDRILVLVNYRGNTVHIPLKLINEDDEQGPGEE
ncbi:DegQ family serine endoprotease [Kordiimonas gwangyangensis]|uniref:DegQ family serine endoprotease n=1 Tax=Kordiimonas gwangyangensis TaxID=288022 RepID=UPI00046E5933|nr:DegQ family serine endoprotease [Kordiimonas gwangyangensis]